MRFLVNSALFFFSLCYPSASHSEDLLDTLYEVGSVFGELDFASGQTMEANLFFYSGGISYYNFTGSGSNFCDGSLRVESSDKNTLVFRVKNMQAGHSDCPKSGTLTLTRSSDDATIIVEILSHATELNDDGKKITGVLRYVDGEHPYEAEDKGLAVSESDQVAEDLSIGARKNPTPDKKPEIVPIERSNSILPMDVSSLGVVDFWTIARWRGADIQAILAENGRSFDSEFDEQRYIEEFTATIEENAKFLSNQISDVNFIQQGITASALQEFDFANSTQRFEFSSYAEIGTREKINYRSDQSFIASDLNYSNFYMHFNDIDSAERIVSDVRANGALMDVSCGEVDIFTDIRPMRLSCAPFDLRGYTTNGELLFALKRDTNSGQWVSEKVSDLWEILPLK